ncbi:MAG TPA: helix-turn-helix domain-containing protein [Mycobacteriales bacterium]|nr:helix-turn-helix domain-containing protein [Mycobacteriales bacterium]
MPSQRHTLPEPRTGGEDVVLRAAKESVLDVGLRRTTLADVARRAGVSRMTVYRRFGDLSSLVSELLTTELLGLVEGARAEVEHLPTARERLVGAGVLVVERLAAHPLWCRVRDLDPELLLPLVVDRFGSSQRAIVDALAAQVAEGQADGSVRPVDPALAATALLLTAQSFVFSARIVAAQHPPPATSAELRRLLDGYLRP